jgi:hypothetical protein
MLLILKRGMALLWSVVLFACGALSIFFAIGVLFFVFPQLVIKQLVSVREDFVLNLVRIVGLFTAISFSLISSAIYLSQQLEKPRFSLVSPVGILARLLKKCTTFEPKLTRALLWSLLLLGLGVAIALYEVNVFLSDTVSKESLTQGQLNTRHLMLDDPVLFYSFKKGRSGIHDITEMRSNDLHDPNPGYKSLLRGTSGIYLEDSRKGMIKIVEVIGYADASGTDEINKRVSRRRAATIRSLLISAGIPETIISTRAAGVRKRSCTPGNISLESLCLQGGDRRTEVYFWYIENSLNKR